MLRLFQISQINIEQDMNLYLITFSVYLQLNFTFMLFLFLFGVLVTNLWNLRDATYLHEQIFVYSSIPWDEMLFQTLLISYLYFFFGV